ncbi:HypC/HybG/HupF family hydrogenase formation chaperone [Bradyrhizobium sp. dw_78]|uniref:HypC/HybG/HupF family hydrogenase formation chaperone n=1 Tax=Bradyrhizobium sp. dw_78 TaxID=2719793 RepID=UPI001BD47EFD|nr:HypC/HybG/HupF family hydrogenase formation chaperone [Bradyrhizobium sp. dw_78]
MCLAIPIRVEQLLPDDMARVTLGGVSKIVSTALVEAVRVGDYLIIHVGYALARLDPDEAERTLALMREAAVPEMEECRP